MPADVSCAVVSNLLTQWHLGKLTDDDRDSYEQHLLVCPPCLQQNDKARLSFVALRSIAHDGPGSDVIARLTATFEQRMEAG